MSEWPRNRKVSKLSPECAGVGTGECPWCTVAVFAGGADLFPQFSGKPGKVFSQK